MSERAMYQPWATHPDAHHEPDDELETWEEPPSVPEYEQTVPPITLEESRQVERSWIAPGLFLLPMFFAGISWISDGIPAVTDFAFITLSVLCVIFFCIELFKFSSRQGIGSLLIFGGSFIWFCHDYLQNWMGHDFANSGATTGLTPVIIAKAAFMHCMFVFLMLIGYRWQIFRIVDRWVVRVPEPSNPRVYLWVLMGMLLFGLSAFVFTSDFFVISILKGGLWFWLGVPDFTVGRTGNMNYNWGGYVAQILQVGAMSGVLGAFYAMLVARSTAGKVFGWAIWLYWTSNQIPGFRRGELAFMTVPVIGLVFVKYTFPAMAHLKPRVIHAFLGTALVAFGAYYINQWETRYRYGWQEVALTRVGGNSMFSEGLIMYPIIPSQYNYRRDTFPGASLLRPIPDTLMNFVIGPIPRALWTTKPIDEASLWYSALVSGDKSGVTSGGVTGTTVSTGACTAWYFFYGPIGVIEGGLLYGWLMGVCERSLRRSKGRPLAILFSLGFATFMFRSYRDLWWHNLYPLMIAGGLMWIFIKIVARFDGRNSQPGAGNLGF